MIDTIKRIFLIPELRAKIGFTLMMLVVCRIGAYVPVPGIDVDKAVNLFTFASGGGQNLFQLMDTFTGGAFAKMTVIALGIMPYITASIIMQMGMALIPSLQRDMKENPELGKKKVSKYTRVITLFLAIFQSNLFAGFIVNMNESSPGIIVSQIADFHVFGVPLLFYFIMVSTMTTGTLFLMWIGEQISEKGIGNGISLIITIGILSSMPGTFGSILSKLNLESQEAAQLSFTSLIVLMALFVVIIVGTILIIQGQRRIPLQYARRVVGRHETQGSSSHIPLKVNYAGVIPVIFGSTVLMFPATVGQFLAKDSWIGSFAGMLIPGNWTYTALFAGLIIFFTYFWTAMSFRPDQIASDMKKNGAFIPGIRQGRPTQEFLEATMNRITFVGAILLAFIAILPTLVSKILGVDPSISHFFGGTTLLILVGVILDTTKQIESHLLMKRYDGFIKKGRIRGR